MKSYLNGGLRMCDVKSFLAAMKVSWLRRLVNDSGSSLAEFFYAMYPQAFHVNKFGGEYANLLMSKIHNPFWKDVLRSYKKLVLKCKPKTDADFLRECIHYNVNILRDNHTVILKEWFDAGILHVHSLLDDTGNWLSFDEFKKKISNS